MPVSGITPFSILTNLFFADSEDKTAPASEKPAAEADIGLFDEAWAWLNGRGQEIMVGLYTGPTVGLTGCALIGEQWAPESMSDEASGGSGTGGTDDGGSDEAGAAGSSAGSAGEAAIGGSSGLAGGGSGGTGGSSGLAGEAGTGAISGGAGSTGTGGTGGVAGGAGTSGSSGTSGTGGSAGSGGSSGTGGLAGNGGVSGSSGSGGSSGTGGAGAGGVSGSGGSVCLPRNYSDTNFIDGTPANVETSSGSIYLPEDYSSWLHRYEGDEDPSVTGWTSQAPSGWTANAVASGELHLSTVGLDDVGRYEINSLALDNSGWMVEVAVRIAAAEAAGSDFGCGLLIGDNLRLLRLRLFTDRIDTHDYSGEYVGDLTTRRVIRVVGSGDDFFVYVDGVLEINGTGLMTLNALNNRFYFGDIGAEPDCEAYWDYVYYTAQGRLNVLSPGTWTSLPIDLSGGINNLGSGAEFSWTVQVPSGTSLIMRVRAEDRVGDDCPADLSAEWSAALATNPAVLPASIAGNCFQWQAELSGSADTPQLESVNLDYCSEE